MPTITTVDATWTNGVAMDEAELRRADSAMFLGDGSSNGVRGGIVRHGDNSLAVSVNGSDQVTVQAGAAVIPAATGLGAYRASLSAATAATGLSSRNATNPRIDLIVMQISSGQAVFKTVDGTPGSSPSAPALPANSIELARLAVPALGGGAVTVDSTWRQYAAALGGTLYVETPARLPGSGNQKGQQAVALNTDGEYVWTGSAWQLQDGVWASYSSGTVMTTDGGPPNLGSLGGASAYYSVRGKTVDYRIEVYASGSGITAGTGHYYFPLPTPVRNTANHYNVGTLHVVDGAELVAIGALDVVDYNGIVKARIPGVAGVVRHDVWGLVNGRDYSLSGTYERP